MENIKLTPKEESIFQFLMDVHKENNLKTTMRVAGGWVRDKLFGIESDDIDIALNDLSGPDFAEILNKKFYQDDLQSGKIEPGTEYQNYKQKYQIVKSNEEKSKNLDTAIIRIQGESIDLVNLRGAKQSDSNYDFGSPKDDALLRDLTINSLFYNVNERIVEDFTNGV